MCISPFPNGKNTIFLFFIFPFATTVLLFLGPGQGRAQPTGSRGMMAVSQRHVLMCLGADTGSFPSKLSPDEQFCYFFSPSPRAGDGDTAAACCLEMKPSPRLRAASKQLFSCLVTLHCCSSRSMLQMSNPSSADLPDGKQPCPGAARDVQAAGLRCRGEQGEKAAPGEPSPAGALPGSWV